MMRVLPSPHATRGFRGPFCGGFSGVVEGELGLWLGLGLAL